MCVRVECEHQPRPSKRRRTYIVEPLGKLYNLLASLRTRFVSGCAGYLTGMTNNHWCLFRQPLERLLLGTGRDRGLGCCWWLLLLRISTTQAFRIEHRYRRCGSGGCVGVWISECELPAGMEGDDEWSGDELSLKHSFAVASSSSDASHCWRCFLFHLYPRSALTDSSTHRLPPPPHTHTHTFIHVTVRAGQASAGSHFQSRCVFLTFGIPAILPLTPYIAEGGMMGGGHVPARTSVKPKECTYARPMAQCGRSRWRSRSSSHDPHSNRFHYLL